MLSMVRDKEKGHGKGGLMDGFVPKKGDSVIVVDDVLTTGGSLRRVGKAITDAGASISRNFVVVNRRDPTLGFDVSYILRVEDIKPDLLSAA